jgi:hypothetical protein
MAQLRLVRERTTNSGRKVSVYKFRKQGGGGKKKQSGLLRIVERAVGEIANGSKAFTTTYADGHRDSNRRKRDGWLRDLNENVYRAARNAKKRIDLPRILGV